jgi:DNA modification methylase
LIIFYLNDLKDIFAYCSKIVKKTGSLWIIIDTIKKNGVTKLLPFDLVREIEDYWALQDIIIWSKDKTLPWSHKGSFRNIFEYILFFTKPGVSDYKYNIDAIKEPADLKRWWVKYPERYNPLGKTPHGLWEFSIPTQGVWGNGWVRHYCPFPPALIEQIIQLTTDEKDVVMDPFAGSGSVLAQARVMKRKAIGFDLSEKYKVMYEKTVYPGIKQKWKIRKKELEEKQKFQSQLKEKINNLRKIKYPKELIKRSFKASDSEDIFSQLNSVFVFENINESTSPEIFFVFDDKTPEEDFTSLLDNVQKIPPLSKYGLKPDIKLITYVDFLDKQNKSKDIAELYLYERGRTHYYKNKMSFETWKEESKTNDWRKYYKDYLPPILSNIKVEEKVRELK